MKYDINSITEVERLAVPVGGRDHIQGPVNASLTLLEYGDYECPFCGQAHLAVKAVQQSLGKRLRFVFRNFPLSNAHPHAEHAAQAAEAAGARGGFWEMHDLLFENQDALEDENLLEYAAALRLDTARVLAEVESGAYARRIGEDFMKRRQKRCKRCTDVLHLRLAPRWRVRPRVTPGGVDASEHRGGLNEARTNTNCLLPPGSFQFV